MDNNIQEMIHDRKGIIGLAIGCFMLLAIAIWCVCHYINKTENPKEVAQSVEITPKPEQMPVPTTAPSRFHDLMVCDERVTTECEPVIESQSDDAFGECETPTPVVPIENSSAPTATDTLATASTSTIRQLIINDDEVALKSLFKGQKLLIEANGFCSDYISEECVKLVESGKVRLVYDTRTPSLLRKIVIN